MLVATSLQVVAGICPNSLLFYLAAFLTTQAFLTPSQLRKFIPSDLQAVASPHTFYLLPCFHRLLGSSQIAALPIFPQQFRLCSTLLGFPSKLRLEPHKSDLDGYFGASISFCSRAAVLFQAPSVYVSN